MQNKTKIELPEREIKFRAWDRVAKKMYFVEGIDWSKTNEIITDVYHNIDISGTIDSPVLMQFTGLHDKNGKEIYEFDIVSVVGDKFVVLWVSCGFQFVDIWTNAKSIKSEEILELYNKGVSIKVIGNIFENSDLLNDYEKPKQN